MSRDHIIAFSQGWIFDSNLEYAIDFSDDNLNWCVGKGKEHEVFGGFHEVVQFRKRIPRKEKKKVRCNNSTIEYIHWIFIYK